MNHISNAFSTVSNGVIDRAIKIIEIIPSALECVQFAGNAVIGVVATPFSAITCGKIVKLNKQADLTFKAKLILPQIFTSLMDVINPDFEAEYEEAVKQGYFSEIVTEIFDDKFVELKNSPSVINRQFVSRALILVGIPVSIVTRVADTIIAIPLVASSLLICGTEQRLNELALVHLRAPLSIFYDVSISLRCFVNPHNTSTIN